MAALRAVLKMLGARAQLELGPPKLDQFSALFLNAFKCNSNCQEIVLRCDSQPVDHEPMGRTRKLARWCTKIRKLKLCILTFLIPNGTQKKKLLAERQGQMLRTSCTDRAHKTVNVKQ